MKAFADYVDPEDLEAILADCCAAAELEDFVVCPVCGEEII